MKDPIIIWLMGIYYLICICNRDLYFFYLTHFRSFGQNQELSFVCFVVRIETKKKCFWYFLTFTGKRSRIKRNPRWTSVLCVQEEYGQRLHNFGFTHCKYWSACQTFKAQPWESYASIGRISAMRFYWASG